LIARGRGQARRATHHAGVDIIKKLVALREGFSGEKPGFKCLRRVELLYIPTAANDLRCRLGHCRTEIDVADALLYERT